MKRILLTAAAIASLAAVAHAQPPGGGEPPNYDTDHDGKVTLSEFKAGQAERETRMFARMDANHDGKITQAEMEAARAKREAAGKGPPNGGGGRGAGFFARFDTNHDGAITKAEMAAATEARFKMADTNNDGWLSKGELLMMRQKMRGGQGNE